MTKHRLDALSDGIFAVAMTLLVIELKVPPGPTITDAAAMNHALAELAPKVLSWAISVLVLGFMWWGHSRAIHRVKTLTGRLAALNLVFLAVVSLIPFAAALSGEFGAYFATQVVYSGTLLAATALSAAIWTYVYRHPSECGEAPMPAAEYRSACARTALLATASVLALPLGWLVPGAGNFAYILMSASRPVASLAERRLAQAAG